jgi:hypothetical protein
MLHLSNVDPALAELPRHGTITFRFCRKQAHVIDGPEQRLDLDIELHEVVAVKAEKHEEEGEEKPGDILDRLMHEAEESEAEEAEEHEKE